jgi:hypothetical protein
MAQSRPTTTTDGGKALAKTIVDLQKRVRTLELREDPTGGGGGGGTSAGWAQVDNKRDWVDGSGAGAYAQIADIDTFADSGGFTLVDPSTLALPVGLYMIEWSLKFWFPFVNPYSGGYTGTGWALWRGGPLAVTNSVRSYTSYDERMLMPIEINDDGGGDASVQTEANKYVAWRGIVRASGTSVNLSLGIVDFYDFFPTALDWASDFSATNQTADNGNGRHNVFIASIGD